MTAREARFPIGATVSLDNLDADLHLTAARLRPTEPVSWVPAIGGWLVVGHAEATDVLRDAATFTVDDPRFSTGQVLGPSMLSTDAAEHDRHRRPFLPSFSRGALRDGQAEIVDDVLHNLLDAHASATSLALRTELARPLATETIARVLGLGVDAATVAGWYDEFAGSVTAISDGATAQAASHWESPSRRTLQNAVDAATKEVPAPSRARVIAEASQAANQLNGQEFASNIGVVLFGAIETSEGMNASALWHLLTVPGLADKAADDPTVIASIVDESLRLEPAAAVVDRYATADAQIGGADIAEGDFVQVSLAGANRDPSVFADPDRFDPTRSDRSRHLSFVVGPHACIGAHLARHQTQALLTGVIDRFPGLQLTSPELDEPTGRIFRKPGPLRATWSPPNPTGEA